jgi:hypothetical protein
MKAFRYPRGLNGLEREVEEGKWKGTSGQISSKEGGGYRNRCCDMDVMTLHLAISTALPSSSSYTRMYDLEVKLSN